MNFGTDNSGRTLSRRGILWRTYIAAPSAYHGGFWTEIVGYQLRFLQRFIFPVDVFNWKIGKTKANSNKVKVILRSQIILLLGLSNCLFKHRDFSHMLLLPKTLMKITAAACSTGFNSAEYSWETEIVIGSFSQLSATVRWSFFPSLILNIRTLRTWGLFKVKAISGAQKTKPICEIKSDKL